MKEAKVGDITVLVVRSKDGFHACGNRCTHYGASYVIDYHCSVQCTKISYEFLCVKEEHMFETTSDI